MTNPDGTTYAVHVEKWSEMSNLIFFMKQQHEQLENLKTLNGFLQFDLFWLLVYSACALDGFRYSLENGKYVSKKTLSISYFSSMTHYTI